jgi:hypothetical protein
LHRSDDRYREFDHLHDQCVYFLQHLRALVRQVFLDARAETEMRAIGIQYDRHESFVSSVIR